MSFVITRKTTKCVRLKHEATLQIRNADYKQEPRYSAFHLCDCHCAKVRCEIQPRAVVHSVTMTVEYHVSVINTDYQWCRENVFHCLRKKKNWQFYSVQFWVLFFSVLIGRIIYQCVFSTGTGPYVFPPQNFPESHGEESDWKTDGEYPGTVSFSMTE